MPGIIESVRKQLIENADENSKASGERFFKEGYCQVFFAHLGITWLVILQMLHVQVRFLTPLRLLDVSESGTDKHQGRASIRKRANAFRSAPDLPVQPFHSIIGSNTPPMLSWEVHVSQGFISCSLYLSSSFIQLQVF